MLQKRPQSLINISVRYFIAQFPFMCLLQCLYSRKTTVERDIMNEIQPIHYPLPLLQGHLSTLSPPPLARTPVNIIPSPSCKDTCQHYPLPLLQGHLSTLSPPLLARTPVNIIPSPSCKDTCQHYPLPLLQGHLSTLSPPPLARTPVNIIPSPSCKDTCQHFSTTTNNRSTRLQMHF